MYHINNTKQITMFQTTPQTQLNHQDQSFSYHGWVPQSTVGHYKKHSRYC